MEEDYYLDISDEDEEYIIQSFGNLEREKKDQMKVIIKPFSGKDLNYITRLTTNAITKSILEKGLKYNSQEYKSEFRELYNIENRKWQFVYRTKELINFKFKVGDKEKVFTDAEELYEFSNKTIAFIVQEIDLHCLGMDRLNSKN